MAIKYGKIHLNLPLGLYKKLQDQAKSELRPVSNLALALIEIGLITRKQIGIGK
jgi:hypothetical protein